MLSWKFMKEFIDYRMRFGRQMSIFSNETLTMFHQFISLDISRTITMYFSVSPNIMMKNFFFILIFTILWHFFVRFFTLERIVFSAICWNLVYRLFEMCQTIRWCQKHRGVQSYPEPGNIEPRLRGSVETSLLYLEKSLEMESIGLDKCYAEPHHFLG